MKMSHRKFLFALALLSMVFTLGTSIGFAQDVENEIVIDVAPNVINLESGSAWVTVHADIPYEKVDKEEPILLLLNDLVLNGEEVEISWDKADDLGDFVAKFMSNDIKSLELEIGKKNTLILTGVDIYGETFFGSQDIKVISVKNKGK